MRVLFGVPDYRRLWGIGAVVGAARWLEFLALGVFAYEVTQSPQLVALVAIVRMAPYMLLGLLVGAIADMSDRRRMLMFAFLAASIGAALMAVTAAFGQAGYGVVLLNAVMAGLLWTTDMPVRRQLMMEAVGPENVAAAASFDSSTMFVMRALGPLAGGILYQWSGITGIFAFCAAIYFACFLLSTGIKAHVVTKAAGAFSFSSLLKMFVPPADLLRSRPLLIVLGITVVFNLWCFPALTMVPVIGEREFGLSPGAIGALSAAEGVGGAIGAIVLGVLARRWALFPVYYFGTFSFLALLFILSLWLTLGMTITVLALVGVASACFAATQYALVYTMAPPAMRGRATGFLSIFIGTSTLGFYNTGLLFDWFSTVDALRIMALQGVVPILLLGVLWMRAKS